jgi:hypothetical protein
MIKQYVEEMLLYIPLDVNHQLPKELKIIALIINRFVFVIYLQKE